MVLELKTAVSRVLRTISEKSRKRRSECRRHVPFEEPSPNRAAPMWVGPSGFCRAIHLYEPVPGARFPKCCLPILFAKPHLMQKNNLNLVKAICGYWDVRGEIVRL